ncbi:MAG: HU family DNA-binding protein [Desulfatiglandaceae bacterium]|jgi:DNA-binding protein HU-beta
MTKAEFVEEMAERCNLSKADAERALNSFMDITKDTLRKEGKLALAGFGSFLVTERKARQGRNPQTGEPIQIPAGKGIRFRAGKGLKDSL